MADGLEVRQDNTQQVVRQIHSAMEKGLEGIGIAAESMAKAITPVDTGRLRNSITHQVQASEKAVYIGTNVEYAPYVEFREDVAHNPPGRAHFLRDTAVNNADKYRKIMENALKSG